MIRKLRFLPILMILTAMFLMAFSPAEKVEAAAANRKIADGVHMGSIDLSGKTLDEAAEAMEEYFETIADSELTINVRNIPTDVLDKMEKGEEIDPEEYEVLYSVEVPVSTFDFDYDIEEAVQVASTLGQEGRLLDRYKTLMDMKFGDAQLPVSYSIDSKKVKAYVDDVFVPENTKDAVDAKFSYSISGFHVTQKEQTGVRVSSKLTANSILQAFEDSVSDKMVCNAMVGTVQPSVTSEDMEDVNFTLVATYTTRFWTYDTEANQNRSHNIRRAAELVNGTMVKPGQYCSLNQTIGQRTEARGFKVAHAYLNGKVIDDVGGGICQFATTLYQCLLQTEMTINARKNHSMRVDYVDYSQDATLDWPGTDLAFTNNWKYPIYITCSTSFGYPSSVTVNFYSYDERPKNRTVEYKTVVDATDKTVYPQIIVDSSKAAGNPTSSGVVLDAVSSHIEKIVRVNGVEQSRTRMNNDFYRALRKIITVGSSGLGLTVTRINDIDQVRDSSGNYLLLNSNYSPIYNGRGGYYLAKDYKHDSNNVAIYSGGSLIPVGGGSSHTHSYSGWTSNGDGTHTGKCSCGDKKTENCSYKNGICTKCGYEKPSSTTEAHTHSYSNWKSNNDGTHTGKCSCGDTKKENCSYKNGVCTKCGYKPTTPATTEPTECSHKWNNGETTTNPTCTAKGVKTYTCTKCGATKTEEIAALGHDYHDTTVAATCTEGGHTTHTCSRCGDSYTDNATSALGHSWNEGTVTKEAGCTEPGVKTYSCTRCDATRTEEIPATGHSYGEWTSNNNGTHSRSCGKGDDTQTENCTYDENGDCTVCHYHNPNHESASGNAMIPVRNRIRKWLVVE